MKRVLVISDNPILASVLARLIDELSLLAIAKFEYRYTELNKSPESIRAMGYSPINIKDHSTITWVITNFDLVLSIHCKQIFPPEVVSNVCCVNLHPGLNPYNRGWYPQVFSIINKMPIGATIHIMNEEVDAGPIIAQKQVEVTSFDTSLSLYKKVQEAESFLLKENIKKIITNNFDCHEPQSNGNYNSINDFKELCCLNLDAVGSLREHIDLLRALTHGPFNNAYFVDEYEHKIFLNIQLVPSLNK
jgi:methionyl-tRNA formyltransferase